MLNCCLLSLITCLSCSKENEVINPVVTKVAIVPTEFTILPDPNREMNNLRVYNKIEYNIKIQNFDTNPNVVYVLKPVTGNAVKHQLKGIDFNIQTLEPNDVYVNRDSIIIKNTNSKMFLQILRPGSFQHEYTLQKMVLNKNSNEPAKQNILFSAIDIRIQVPPKWSPPDEWERLFIFSVDDGEQTNDNYLTSSSNKSQTYSVSYDGGNISSNFDANYEFYFRTNLHSNDNFPPVTNFLINNLKITQSFVGGSTNIINYNNIQF